MSPRLPADNVTQYRIYFTEYSMQFKNLVLLVSIWWILAPASEAACWLSRTPKTIIELDISITTQVEFSLHPTSGIIMAKQYRRKTQQNVYYGDFGVLRMYSPKSVTVYEGAYMKIMPLLHHIKPWLTSKYSPHNVLELQVMYGFTFGKKESNSYQEIGMTYFIVGVDTNNQTKIQAGQNIVTQLLALEKGQKFKLEQYFKAASSDFANNVYLYEALGSHLEKFLPLASDSPQQCKTTLWVLQRNALEIDLGSLNRLKSQLKIGNISTEALEIKAKTARLRKDNKKEGGLGVIQMAVPEQESNSCAQNQQL